MNITEDLLDQIAFEYGMVPESSCRYESMTKKLKVYQNDQVIMTYDPILSELVIAPKLIITDNLLIDGTYYGYRPFIEENLRVVDEIITYIKQFANYED